MKPWFEKESNVIKFPTPKAKVIQMPNVQSYPDFLTGVKDLHNRKAKGEISQDSHDKLYQDLIHRFMRKEDSSRPWFQKELEENAMTARDYAPLIQTLSSQGLNVNPRPKPSRLRKIVHARVTNPVEKITGVLQQLGAKFKVVPGPNELSGKFSQIVAQFPKQVAKQYPELAGKTFNIASAVKKGSSVGIKVFTPTNLGLANKTMSRTDLYNTLKSTIPGKVNDEITEELLLQLLDVAVKKKRAVDPDIIEQFNADDLRQLGVDFGEILGPLMSGEDAIKFPAGNSMLADVEINGKPISVKSASGSGTSFKAILPYLDKLKTNNAVKLNQEETKVNNFFRAFVDTKGNNMDKIVAGSKVANTPEHQAMAKLVGNKNFTVADLENYAGTFGKREYGKFLNSVYPVAVAGGYKTKTDKDRPNGLPQDAAYYMHKSNKKPKAKQAGKPSWDAEGPRKAGSNIMVYILGASFLADAKKEEKKDRFSKFLSKVMQGVDAEIMWVNINGNGTLTLQRKPIKDVQANFQYHAPSHIPGNNLPGFSLKL
jgi:hypothetical protein